MKLSDIEPKQAGKRAYLRAKASPGGWVSIWGDADIALVKAHLSSGVYEGQIVEETRGEYTNRNLSGLTWSDAAPEPVPAGPAASNGHVRASNESGWRLPDQIIRTDALREAREVLDGSDPTGEEVIRLAVVFERYISTGEYEIAPDAVAEPDQTAIQSAPARPAQRVTQAPPAGEVDWLAHINAAMSADEVRAVYREASQGVPVGPQRQALIAAATARKALIDRELGITPQEQPEDAGAMPS